MVLKFKNPAEKDLKKVMVFGLDGSGKSTFAANYCKENNLEPAVVIDIDDTNRTNLYTEGRVLDLNFTNDFRTFNSIISAVKDISETDEIKTIIVDGCTSLLEMLVSDARGMAKYSDRALRFNKIVQALLSSGKHLILIGQADMQVIYNEDVQSSKAVIKLNSIVNEKYLCEKDSKGNFTHKCVKFRTTTETSVSGETPAQVDDDPLREICQKIKEDVEREGKLVTKSSMKSKLVKMIKEGEIEQNMRPSLIKYIQKHCPEELD